MKVLISNCNSCPCRTTYSDGPTCGLTQTPLYKRGNMRGIPRQIPDWCELQAHDVTLTIKKDAQ